MGEVGFRMVGLGLRKWRKVRDGDWCCLGGRILVLTPSMGPAYWIVLGDRIAVYGWTPG